MSILRAKNQAEEELLREMNRRLVGLEEALQAEHTEPRKAIVFIVGIPRSGTTLISQILSQTGAFGYVSNFLARFWMAPKLGALLERALGIRNDNYGSTFQSDFGVTDGPAEPHEFGYFWNRWFDLGGETHKLSADDLARVDVAGLRKAIAALESVFAAPMLFKNPTWCNFQISFLFETFPKAVFVVADRDPLMAAQSILTLRLRHLGSRDEWLSLKPPQYPWLRSRPWPEQIAGQVVFTASAIEEAVSSLPDSHVVRAPYTGVCRAPEALVEKVAQAVEQVAGEKLVLRRPPPAPFTPADHPRIPVEDLDRLGRALEAYRTAGVARS